MNENKVRGEILSRFVNLTAFAEKLGWSRQKISYIVSGEREPSLGDIQVMADCLGISADYLASLFLALLSQNCDK